MCNCKRIGDNGSIETETDKIDHKASLGLLGAEDSLSYKVTEIEKHLHNRERWRGKLGVQTATNWSTDGLIPFRAISGANAYGTDPNDEAQVIGSSDLPIIVGMVKYDPYRIIVTDLSSNTPWKLRMIYGTGTMADAIAAGQYTEAMVINIIATGNAGGLPMDFRMPRVLIGTKIWVQAWNASDNATCDFFVGVHEYEG